jgi:hypothetical protein
LHFGRGILAAPPPVGKQIAATFLFEHRAGSWNTIGDRSTIVTTIHGQKLAFIYCEDEPARRSAAKLFSKDEARRIAANLAKLPRDLLRDRGR